MEIRRESECKVRAAEILSSSRCGLLELSSASQNTQWSDEVGRAGFTQALLQKLPARLGLDLGLTGRRRKLAATRLRVRWEQPRLQRAREGRQSEEAF